MSHAKVTLPNLPAKRAADYRLDEHNGVPFDPPRYARVIYTPQESAQDRRVIETQAFEVDEDGVFVSNPTTGAPSRTAGNKHTISTSGLGDTHTLLPGWTRVVGTYNPDLEQGQPNCLPPNCEKVEVLPSTGVDGDLVYFQGHVRRWSHGELESIMHGRACDLAGLLMNSAAVADIEL